MKYVLVVYSYSKKEYRRVIGEPTENHNKLCKAMIDWFPPNPINHICSLHSNRSLKLWSENEWRGKYVQREHERGLASIYGAFG